MSLLLGLGSVVTSQLGDLELAGWMIVWCGLLDTMDGVAARLLKATSTFGAEFDSMADLIAFGVAPGMLVSHRLRRRPGDAGPARGNGDWWRRVWHECILGLAGLCRGIRSRGRDAAGQV